MDIATWSLPIGYSANSKQNIINRASQYRFGQDHYLKDGTKIIPKISTVMHVLEAYDKFGLELAISEGSYEVEEEMRNTYADD
tara:strand:- start:380 stop:628 length:249 start_codon:yes stop_codon:yes gene_type:complete